MKRLIAMVLSVCLMLLGCVPAVAAGSFDIGYYRKKSNIFTITPNSDGYAFIDCDDSMSIRERSFKHKYEHPSYYSYIYTDLIVLDYFSTSAYPCMRLWIDYEGTKNIYATSVTFVIDDKEYTFSGVGDSDRITTNDGGVSEILMIKFSTEHGEFIAELAAKGMVALENYVADDD